MLLPFISQLATTLLLSASTLINPTNPTTPKTPSFDASAYITVDHKIRLSVQKSAEMPAVMLLRDKDNQVIFEQNISKRTAKYSVKLNVDELADGHYELEVKSSEGSIVKQLNLSTQPTQETSRSIAMH